MEHAVYHILLEKGYGFPVALAGMLCVGWLIRRSE
jgi:hypothetical protein